MTKRNDSRQAVQVRVMQVLVLLGVHVMRMLRLLQLQALLLVRARATTVKKAESGVISEKEVTLVKMARVESGAWTIVVEKGTAEKVTGRVESGV